MSKRGRKRVERRWALYDPLNNELAVYAATDLILTNTRDEMRQEFGGGIPVRVRIQWEEPPRKEKRT